MMLAKILSVVFHAGLLLSLFGGALWIRTRPQRQIKRQKNINSDELFDEASNPEAWARQQRL